MNFEKLTQVKNEQSPYQVEIRNEMVAWQVNGGFLAAIVLRAAGKSSRFSVPASLDVQFLRRANLGDALVEVTSIHASSSMEYLEAQLIQDGKLVLRAGIWTWDRSVSGHSHSEHYFEQMPNAPQPQELLPLAEMDIDLSVRNGNLLTFWNNFEERHIRTKQPAHIVRQPQALRWLRPKSSNLAKADSFTNLSRTLPIVDVMWAPAAYNVTPGAAGATFHLAISFFESMATEWLLGDATCSIIEENLMKGEVKVWTTEGRLACHAISLNKQVRLS